jgi:7,8-dihydro-6-hydroxymethylpterin-pyrophosphokinase
LRSDRLDIPHPRAHERRFVLDPLIELLGEHYALPGKGPLKQLRSRCSEQMISVLCEFPE